MSAVAAPDAAPAKIQAGTIAEHFRSYNEEFARITRRAALNFLSEDWQGSQLDAVARIELYEQRVTRCVSVMADALSAPAHRRGAVGRHQARLRDAGGAPPRQRLLQDVLQLGNPRAVRHRGRQHRGGVLRHERGPRLRCGAAARLPDRRLAAPGGARDHRRPAVRGGHRGSGRGRSPHQRRDRPLLRIRPPNRRTGIHRADRARVLPRDARLRGGASDRRRDHHPAGHRIHELAAAASQVDVGDAVARRRRIAVRLCAILFSRRPAGRQRGHHAAALVHAAQAGRRAVYGARPRQTGQNGTLFRPAAASRAPPSTASSTPRRARPGHDRLHAALARSGVQGHPGSFRRAEDLHPRGRHRALPIRVPPRSRRPPGRRPGIPPPAPAARALHAGAGR